MSGAATSPDYAAAADSGPKFSLVHPTLVDLGTQTLATDTQFWALALSESGSTTVTRHLWALPMDSTGTQKAAAVWLGGTTVNGASGIGDLHDITAVCGMDAAVLASGEVGVTIVVRRGLKDQVLLARFKDGVQVGAPDVVKEAATDATNACNYGIIAARVAAAPDGYFILYSSISSGGSTGTATLAHAITGAPTTYSFADIPTTAAWTTDNADSSSVGLLASRGLAAPVHIGGGVVSVVLEAKYQAQRAIKLYTFKP